MPYVITQNCCNDASCISACPVDCIRPTPDQPEFATAEMLYIDPATCIDCGSCVPACPVGAIFPEDDLTAPLRRYTDINAAYFRDNPLHADINAPLPTAPHLPHGHERLRVAIVGSGPAANYAARALLANTGVEVDLFEKLPTPGGLVRAGVAPDHPDTKSIGDRFETELTSDALAYHLNITVGEHIQPHELLDYHHAVIYAVGAAADRELGIPGEQLPGSHSATEFIAWYNGHPDYTDRVFDLSTERAVVIGNGNVALDLARILTTNPADLARTDIADHALDALRRSRIREVVVLGRRSPLQAAYTGPELLALSQLPGVDVQIDQRDLKSDAVGAAEFASTDPAAPLKWSLAQEYARSPRALGHRRITLRYLCTPVSLRGTDRVRAVDYARNNLEYRDGEIIAMPTGSIETIETSLVLRSIGYRALPVPGLPFDEQRGVIPNDHGRVLDAGTTVPGTYVTGWIKRGPHGGIGINRNDAEQTVAAVFADFTADRLRPPRQGREALINLLIRRQPNLIDRSGWQAIDTTERAAGRAGGRPRVKLTDHATLVAVAHADSDATADGSRT
ncbi:MULTISPECIES: FAD-dependent oxidoreductase [unclassified Nocardia]|uniref:FAD-dependent oxidoreductase n=1 Tax=unclassified Nocardia TaxID=2637762 RepID=UPI001CE3C139|nr:MULTISPECIES: FAD-dependent oxidoreductase [unclassified Nocardia]